MGAIGILLGIEMNLLLFASLYIGLGYLTFRGWLKVSPPQHGRFGNDGGYSYEG
ncbi:hypothetical protein LCGC14_1994120, partial [marine sediment metagenome]